MFDVEEVVQEKIERVVTNEGYELVHIEFNQSSGKPVLRLFIDRPGGITLDDCQSLSKQISTMLDVEDPIPSKYVLEVSSPGLDRRLYKETDYVRFVGRRVRVTLRQPVGGRRTYRGKLLGVGEGVVRIAESAENEWSFKIEAISKANLEIEI